MGLAVLTGHSGGNLDTETVAGLQLDAGGVGGRVPVQGVDAGGRGGGGQVTRRPGSAGTIVSTVPDIEIVKTESVVVRVVRIRGLSFDQKLVLDGQTSIKLILDPAVIKLQLRIQRLGLNLRFSVLQIALHLVTCLMPIFFK